jgi:hypothetical protein
MAGKELGTVGQFKDSKLRLAKWKNICNQCTLNVHYGQMPKCFISTLCCCHANLRTADMSSVVECIILPI